jgi:signal peptidase I
LIIRRNRILKPALFLLLLVVGIPYFYYLFFLHLIRVPGGSMANTIIPGDRLVVKKRAFGEINRGDLIVFRYPRDLSTHFLSRVIGLPRESIEIRGKFVYINGSELPEQRVTVKPDNLLEAGLLEEFSTEGTGPYRVFYISREGVDVAGVSPDLETGAFGTKSSFQIPDNEYYVMGDNRDNSEDSRYKGTVPRSLIFGKPTMIYWSAGRDKMGNETVRWDRIFTRIRNH